MKCAPLLIAIVVALTLTAQAADEAAEAFKIQLSGWSYGRERKTITSSNRVTANFNIKNTSQDNLEDVNLTLNYASGLGEKTSGPIKQKVGALKAGETKKIAMVGDFIPIFSSYTITVEYKPNKKEEWFANSDIGQPQPKNTEPLKGVANVVVLGKEANSDRFGRFGGTVRVKNEGTVEAKNLKITVTFFDAKKNKIHEWSGRLGKGTLAGGAEENIQFSAATAPRSYMGYEIKVGCDDAPLEAGLAGGEFTTAEAVEFAKFVFSRPKPPSLDLKVTAQARNGFPVPVEQVKLTLVFYGNKKKELKRFTYEVPGQLKPAEIKPVEFTMAEIPGYESYEQLVDFTKVGGAPAAAPAVTKAQPGKFQKLPDVEVIFTDSATNDDKSVSLLGAVRNGKSTPVKDVMIMVTFTMPNGETIQTDKVLTDITQSGEERNFVLKSPASAGFANYSFKFKYSDASGLVAPQPDVPTQTTTRADPPAPEKPAAPPEKEKEKAKEPEKPKGDPVKNALDGAL